MSTTKAHWMKHIVPGTIALSVFLSPMDLRADSFSSQGPILTVETYPEGYARFMTGGKAFWLDCRTDQGKATLANVLSSKAMGSLVRVWHNQDNPISRFGQSGFEAIIVSAE